MARTKKREVDYKVSGYGFGSATDGEMRKAILLIEEESMALIYHPRVKDRQECGSLEFAVNVGSYYVAVNGKNTGYVNISSQRELDRLANNLKSISYINDPIPFEE